MRRSGRPRSTCLTLPALLLGVAGVLALVAGGAPAAASTVPVSGAAGGDALPPAAPLPRDQGIQGGWAVDDGGDVAFPHGLMAQLPLIQATGAGWLRINFRL